MTTPAERTRAVNMMGEAVTNLGRYLHGRGRNALVPRETIRCLFSLLRHYPMPCEITMTARAAPDLWAPSEDMDI